MNPSISLELILERLTESSLPHFFYDVDVLVRHFDAPVMENRAITDRYSPRLLVFLTSRHLVELALFGENNASITKTMHPRIFIVDDKNSEAKVCK